MQTFLLVLLTAGLAALQTTLGQDHTGRCSYAGVVHLEGSSSYSLDFQQAMKLCQSLGYSLASEEQLGEAYNKGLRTCRYGWIEGQKISFLPNNVDPNCTSDSTGIVFHDEKADNLHDVYCFTKSDSLETGCKDAMISVSSRPLSSQLTTTIAKPNPDGDVLDEAVADGFIVDVKGTTSSVKTVSSEDTHKTTTTPNSVMLVGNPSQPPQENTVTVPKDPEVATVVDTSSTKELPNIKNAGTPPTIVHDHYTTTFPEEKSEALPDLGVTEIPTKVTTNGIADMSGESSGMYPEIPEKKNKGFLFSTSLRTPVRFFHNDLLTPEAENGSGMEPEVTTSNRFTTTTTIIIEEPLIEERESEAEAPKQRMNLPADPQPTTAARAEEGTPSWLIIFAFCLTLCAIVLVLAGIATKDMWYGPSRRSLNITPKDTDEEYGKAATLPLSEKEQELVTLMNTKNEQKGEKDCTIISLEEAPEKEYLM